MGSLAHRSRCSQRLYEYNRVTCLKLQIAYCKCHCYHEAIQTRVSASMTAETQYCRQS